MKVTVDTVDLFELTDTQKNILAYMVPSAQVSDKVKELVWSIILEKYKNTYSALRRDWIPKLELAEVTEIPAEEEAFATLVFSQPDYKDKTAQNADLPEGL